MASGMGCCVEFNVSTISVAIAQRTDGQNFDGNPTEPSRIVESETP
jgi:hypothetical protein